MGKKRRNLDSRTCLSVKSVKSVVPFFWLWLAKLRPRAFALKRLPQSHPVKPGQTIFHTLTMRGKSMEVPVHQQLTRHPIKLHIETSQTQSNLVKPLFSTLTMTPSLHHSIPILSSGPGQAGRKHSRIEDCQTASSGIHLAMKR
jgi:hypothetical protein